jgi:hypothetical protein
MIALAPVEAHPVVVVSVEAHSTLVELETYLVKYIALVGSGFKDVPYTYQLYDFYIAVVELNVKVKAVAVVIAL